jgi:hypothetical protein
VPVAPIASGGNGVPFLVSAGLVYEIIAANCSSPQTTEINAGSRASTLMKWVHLGLGQAVAFVALAVIIDRKHAGPIIGGGALAAAIQYGCFVHAKASGLKNGGPGTEH